jgi:hypothetical protein
MARKKGDLPEWLPFALAASAVVALVAGARSGWTLSGDRKPPPPPPPPTPVQAGVLQDWFAGDYRI